MVRISKYKLTEETLVKLYQLFFNVLISLRSNTKFINILDDIFSPTEKIMMAKRMMLIYLIIKGINQRAIAKALKLSTSTVSKYAVIFYNKDTDLIKVMKNIAKKENIDNILGDIFTNIFIQPGFKTGHWRMYWKHKRSKKQRERRGF